MREEPIDKEKVDKFASESFCECFSIGNRDDFGITFYEGYRKAKEETIVEHTETRYEATLRCRDGVEYTKIPMIWCRTFEVGKNGKTMWAVYNSWDNRCTPYFSNKYQDSELYDAGFLK